jgi:hypothetical protein
VNVMHSDLPDFGEHAGMPALVCVFFLCPYVRACVHVCVFLCMSRIRICLISASMPECLLTYVFFFVPMCVCVCVFVPMCVCVVCVCSHVCICICACGLQHLRFLSAVVLEHHRNGVPSYHIIWGSELSHNLSF